MPDRRQWRQPRSLLVDSPGGLNSGSLRRWDKNDQPLPPEPRDYLALRWHDGWRMVERWRPEREGILCVLEQGGGSIGNGGTIWVDKAGGLMATGEVTI